MLLTFAANAVDLPDRLLSRSFTDTVDLPPLTAAVDLLIRPEHFAVMDLPISPDTGDLPLA